MFPKSGWRRFSAVVALAFFLFLLTPSSGLAVFLSQERDRSTQDEPEGILLQIYREVQELGYRDEEDFLKREFHFDLDGITSNREEHIVVLGHRYGNGERMILQVTTFGEAANQYYVRYPVNVSEIMCYIEGNALQIRKCGYDVHQTQRLLPEILKGIRSEIKLLRLVEHKK